MPKRYPQDQRQRAVRMVLDHLIEYDSVFAACSAIGPKLNIGRESQRRWVLQAQIDADERPGVTSAEQTRIRNLESEIREPREANEILKKASIFFARELDPRRRR
ncbi:transposase [Arthrobacter sp. HLT1-21]